MGYLQVGWQYAPGSRNDNPAVPCPGVQSLGPWLYLSYSSPSRLPSKMRSGCGGVGALLVPRKMPGGTISMGIRRRALERGAVDCNTGLGLGKALSW